MDLAKFFVHTATYWSKGAPDGYGGYSWNSSSEIAVRWEDRAENFIDSQGNEFISQSVVYTDQTLEIAGYLYLGSSAATDPTTVTGAIPIKQLGSTPSLDGSQSLVKAYLRG